jgi:hypothetical protein
MAVCVFAVAPVANKYSTRLALLVRDLLRVRCASACFHNLKNTGDGSCHTVAGFQEFRLSWCCYLSHTAKHWQRQYNAL